MSKTLIQQTAIEKLKRKERERERERERGTLALGMARVSSRKRSLIEWS